MVFRQVGSDTDKLISKFGLLNKSFADIKTDLTNKQGWRSFGNFVSQKDVDNFLKFQQEIKNGTSYHKAFNSNLSTSHTYIQKQAVELRKLYTEQGLLNRQLKSNKITQEQYNTAMAANKAQIQALTSSTQKLTLAQKASAVASKAMGVALNVAMNMAVTTVINGIISGISYLVKMEETAIEKTKESTQTYKDQITSLEECKEKYLEIIDSEKTYVEKTKEINKWKETLVGTYGFEKEALEKVNAERKTGIELIDDEIEKSRNLWLGENAVQAKKAKSKIETDLFSDFSIQNASVENKSLEENIRQEILDIFDSATQEWDSGNAFLNYDEQISLDFNTDTVYETKEKIEEALAVLGEIGYDNLNYQEKELLKQLNSHKEKIDKIIEDYGDTYSTFNEYTAQNLFSQFISQSGNQISSVTEDTFSTWETKLLDMAGESETLKIALQDIIKGTFPQFAESNNSSETAVNSTTESIYNFIEATETLKEQLDNTFSNQSTIQSAFDKIQEGTSLSADEVRELVELCPSLADEFEKTADGWTIGADKLISANENITRSAKTSIENQIALLKEVNKPTSVNSKSDWEQYDSWNKAQQEIAGLELILSMFGLTTDNATEELNDFGKMAEDVSSKSKLISTAIDEINADGQISASTYAEIIAKGEDYANCIDIVDGKLKLNIQALKDLEAQSYKTTISTNNHTIAEYQRLAAIEAASSGNWKKYSELITQLQKENLLNQAFIDEIYGANGNDNAKDTGDSIKAAFEADMQETEHLYVTGLISQKEYLDKLEQENEEHYKNSTEHYDEYLSNLEKIYNGRKDLFKSGVDEQVESLNEQLEKGFINPLEWQSEMTKLMEQSYGMGSKYYGTEFATENYQDMSDMIVDKDVDVYEHKFAEIKKANDGSIEAERRFIEQWKSLNKQMFEGSDPKRYEENLEEIAEYEEEWLVNRAETEKTYWENLKQEVEDYYDKEIEKLQAILDKEEKVNKQEELRNNLIKARQELENAKKNKNQLIFANGTFEYAVDQEAVEQATEAEKDAQRELERFETEQEIATLQEEQKKKIDDIDAVINRIEEYIKKLNGETEPTSSDTQIISNADATEEANKAQNSYDELGKEKDNNSDTSTEVKTDTVNVTVEQTGSTSADNVNVQGVETDNTVTTTETQTDTSKTETVKSPEEVLLHISDSIDIIKARFESLLSDENRTYYQNQNNELQLQRAETSPAYAQAVYNNSTVNNDNSQVITIGDINVTVEGGSSEQMIREFASKLGSTIQSITGRIT